MAIFTRVNSLKGNLKGKESLYQTMVKLYMKEPLKTISSTEKENLLITFTKSNIQEILKKVKWRETIAVSLTIENKLYIQGKCGMVKNMDKVHAYISSMVQDSRVCGYIMCR